tara:strand:- start:416 stop:637 length:222 start_codon:yes stop_codon:yes gene_type:complete
MYSNYILYFLVLVILFFLIINNVNLNNKEEFDNAINGNIVILNKKIRNINNSIDNPEKSKLLIKLITLDTIDI